MSDMKRALIFVEKEHKEDAINLLETARQIYKEESYETYALLINSSRIGLEGKFDFILNVSAPQMSDYDQISTSDILIQMHQQYSFDCILIPATQKGRMLAPRTAMLLETGIVADVTEISHSTRGVELIRPAYSGRIMAVIEIKGDGPVMMTVRPDIFTYADTQTGKTKVIDVEDLSFRSGGIREILRKEKAIEYDIRKSNVLISGGGGISNSFELLPPLAELLNGNISASRAAVDKGIVSRNYQVGQSGKTVSPELYIALGINGAIQHVEGLKNVDNIISVNTNKNAPICSLSDIVVEGDAVTFIKKLIEKIKKENKENECK